MRSASSVTGKASAAKLVPQRGENRVGFARPSTSRRASAPRRLRSRGARRRAGEACGRAGSSAAGRRRSRRPPTVDHGAGRNASRAGAITAAEQQPALARPGNAGTAEQRPERGGEPDEPTGEREPLKRLGRLDHRPLAQGAVRAGERPEALADDDDAVRPGHPAEAGKRGARSPRAQRVPACPRHDCRAKRAAPPRRNGPCFESVGPSGLPNAAREEPEQRQHQDDNQDDPENPHVVCLLCLTYNVGAGYAGTRRRR